MRSLERVAYQDGVNRGRSSLKDSYGNPVQYDTLEAIDAKKPSKNLADPNKFIIPGYASGILQPHEVPTRSNDEGEATRKLDDDDRIHFVDPLQNSFQNTNKPFQAPSPSLSAPLGSDTANANNQQPIKIPRPNIDSPQTPQAPIDDPLNHPLSPPLNDKSGGAASLPPSFSLQVPTGPPQVSVTQDLIPPQIPSHDNSVFIPRPNLDISETPIDNSNGPVTLNQGLLPPTDDSVKNFDNTANTFLNPTANTFPNPNAVNAFPSPNTFPTPNTFSNPNQDGPIEITEVHFAPKPSNGLVPPKDPSPNDINFQSPDAQPTFASPTLPTPTNPNKFSFGASPGILQQAVNKFSGAAQDVISQGVEKVQNRFTGSFGGAPGVLGGKPATSSQNQIPVAIVQSPIPSQASPASATTANRYQGNFGGAPGVLANNQYSGATQAQATEPIPSIAPPTLASPPNKFTGSFGGPPGGLGGSKPLSNPPTTQTLTQLPNVNSNLPKDKIVDKYTGQFGGPAGVLRPNDVIDVRINP